MKILSTVLCIALLSYVNAQCNPDVTAPNAICQNVSVYLDGSGNASITSSDIDNGSNDNCSGVSLLASQTNFSCNDIGVVSVSLTVSDNATSEIVDQQNLVAPTYSAWDAVGQSFTAGITGLMTKLEIQTGYNSDQFSTLSIRSGGGVTGPVLSTQTIDMLFGGSGYVNNLITLATPVNVVSGQVYTFSLTDNFGQVTSVDMSSNPYSGGTAYVNGGAQASYDLYFITYIESNISNVASCIATVTVMDTISPVADVISLPNVFGCFGDQITPNIPTATDNCAGPISGTSATSFPISSGGTTVVNWLYDDGNGNTFTQSQNVIILSADVNITQNAQTITAVLSGATSYQWLDCDNGLSIIPGETNQSYTPNSTGNYAVLIINNSCTDTSACLMAGPVGLEELINGAKTLVRVVDLFGRETPYKPNTLLFYIYSNGAIERVFKMED